MLIDNRTGFLGGLQTVPAELVQIRSGSQPLERQYWLRGEQESDMVRIARPERILFTALNPPCRRCLWSIGIAWTAGIEPDSAADL